MPDEKEKEFLEEEDDFFKDVIDEEESEKKEEEPSDEEKQRQKNKDAEEARKRREREAKEKAEKEKEEAEKKKEEETPPPAEEKKAEKEDPQSKEDEKDKRVKELGKQLYDFQQKYPDIDIASLDKDAHFKNYLEGKLLGKKNFTELYEDYVALKTELSGKEKENIINEYLKSNSSSGSSGKGATRTDDVYSEDELNEVAEKLRTMNPSDAKKVREKFYRSLDFYEKNKK